jgi:phosphate transport system protein
METHFQQELNELKSELLRMAGLVERAIGNAIEALVKRDTPLAEKTIREDAQINELEINIDERCLKLLALHQPLAADLRFITSAMRINIELERIWDLAVNIGERVISLNQEPQLKPYIDLPDMAEITKKMLRDVLDAFVNGDAPLARSVCERDDQVDGLNDQVFRELLTYMPPISPKGSSSWLKPWSSNITPMQVRKNGRKSANPSRGSAAFGKG